jgi:type I restriction enzyme M protein
MKKTLWEAADKLRAQMDAAEYKHLVLGLIFLKYVSDAFDERRREVARIVADPSSEWFWTRKQIGPTRWRRRTTTS